MALSSFLYFCPFLFLPAFFFLFFSYQLASNQSPSFLPIRFPLSLSIFSQPLSSNKSLFLPTRFPQPIYFFSSYLLSSTNLFLLFLPAFLNQFISSLPTCFPLTLLFSSYPLSSNLLSHLLAFLRPLFFSS